MGKKHLSPFIYGNTVSDIAFTDRKEESEKLYNNLTQGINTSIISPRRWGKSSLVEKVVSEINENEKNIKTTIIDLFSVSDEEEFFQVFAREVIKASSSKVDDWIKSGKTFFKQVIPKISIGIDPCNDFSLGFNWDDAKHYKDEILNLPQTIATKKKTKFIICLDEFQNVAGFSDYESLEKKMRACWHRQKDVTYCLYGSKRHMMTDIFNNSSKPFYRFGDIILLGKISTENWKEFITGSFENTGVNIPDDLAEKIPVLMKNHSWYVQQLSHYVWQKSKTKVTKDDLHASLSELIGANTPLYQKEIESISSTQLNLLKAISQGETTLTGKETMRKYKLGTPRNVSKNKLVLEKADIIYENEGNYYIMDPAFELWFLKQFFGVDFHKF